jgi:quinoprotein glucose dehydrogenase
MYKREPSILKMGRAVCLLLLTATVVRAQSGAKDGEWPTYGGDLGNTHYSTLDQINGNNFNKLEVAWRFKTDNLGPRPEYKFESTPLMVRGVLYTTAGSRRAVVALNATTGEMLWMHSEMEGKRAELSPRRLSGRGLAYWSDGQEERVLYVTTGYRLIALNAKSGVPVTGFGKNGVVDLKEDFDQDIDLVTGVVGLHASPMVAKNVVIVGAAFTSGKAPASKTAIKGYVRGFDVRTGKRLWIFHTIPKPGEFGLDTWEKDSWSYTGNTGVWGQISVDAELGIAYLPVEMPTGDYYGGHRPGNGLFGETLVAVDLQTGERKWHYQLVHHGLWDMDIPCAPILTDITVGGRTVKAVAQPSKQAFLYVFDRITGTPVWPIEERPVPKGDVPGEWYSPTQPFPTKPPAFDYQEVTVDKLIDFTPELRQEAVKLVSNYRLGPMFLPPLVTKPGGQVGALTVGTANGGANWPGGAYDPETHRLYVYSQSTVRLLGLIPPPKPSISDMDYIQGPISDPEANPKLRVEGLPLLKPPYGRITAYDMNAGTIVWQVAHGETPDDVRKHPALQGLQIPRTGQPGIIGTLVTKTLVIAGEPEFTTTASGLRGAMLRAYDKQTGKEVGSAYLPAPQSGSPMTYMANARQYIVVAVSGANHPGELVAFRLPSD